MAKGMVSVVPRISFRSAGLKKPKKIDVCNNPKVLPQADVLVVCHTNVMVSAVNHVFFSYTLPCIENTYQWQYDWRSYNGGANELQPLLLRPVSTVERKPLGFFRMAEIKKKKILFIKPNIPACIDQAGLAPQLFLRRVLGEVSPRQIYSVEPFAAARESDQIGDIICTNAAHCLFIESLRSSDLNGLYIQTKSKALARDLYPFSGYLTPPEISLNFLTDIAEKLGRSCDLMRNRSMDARMPHPLLFSRIGSPLLASDQLTLIHKPELYEEYAAIGSGCAGVLHLAELEEIEALALGAICSPFTANTLPEKDRAFITAEIFAESAPVALVNVARVLLKIVSID